MDRVLIVDDNTTLAYFTARNLERDIEGLSVTIAAGYHDAREHMKGHEFRAVISDLHLTDGNGLELMDEIMEESPGTPVILISGAPPPPELRPDLFGFLLKPYEAPALSELVRAALSTKKGSSADTIEIGHESDSVDYDVHSVRNQLCALLTGLRAFESVLRENAEHPEAVRRTIDRYIDRLCDHVHKISNELPKRVTKNAANTKSKANKVESESNNEDTGNKRS
ncbi:response regulator [Desulfomonile tiedjei]|uniref:Response regulator with CheY-like receiver, AAA-type ATPase, and DNA-binding domains n=1 Tax=Desulfomonile tiedjei (strain ATCC 49306 / DSM 6799 / DCB-1) TaxID=706587 RepID=I4C391_DESTA|nr:response regulator [Desulfomonile tiedjei]AFM24032.1 response regulator with CheY-like receiver, AAA-type ATPase, and DNA-binding domains [Desulfomonile tiedjei DSM 6799]